MKNIDKCSTNVDNCSCDDTLNPLLACFFSLPPQQFALLSSFIGILLVDKLDLNQQNSFGNFLVSLGSTVLAAAAQGQLIESNDNKNDEKRQQIDILKKQICKLEKC